jgi:hypothetical protein
MKRSSIFGAGIVLTILGLFLFGIGYSAYQTCSRQFLGCNNTSYGAPWALPMEIVGGILTALGAGLIVVPLMGVLESNRPNAP